MNKKSVLLLIISVVLLAGVFVGIGVVITNTTKAEVETTAKEENSDAATEKSDDQDDSATKSAERKAAEGLIDQTVSREEIEEIVGEWDDFEMSSAGCERGVYSGKFFYKDFIIHSRTYDKGKTFHVMSVN